MLAFTKHVHWFNKFYIKVRKKEKFYINFTYYSCQKNFSLINYYVSQKKKLHLLYFNNTLYKFLKTLVSTYNVLLNYKEKKISQ